VSKAWYVVHTYSGYEQKVKTNLEDQFQHKGLQDKVGEVVIPTEEVVEIRQGKKRVTSRKFFPGYILVNIEMDQDIWYLIKDTPKVTGFPGASNGLPSPLPDDEVKTILEQIRGEATKPKPKISYEKGESVRVIDGPFVNFSGVVEDVNLDKGKVRVMVSIFGRATPVELEFPQVEKV